MWDRSRQTAKTRSESRWLIRHLRTFHSFTLFTKFRYYSPLCHFLSPFNGRREEVTHPYFTIRVQMMWMSRHYECGCLYMHINEVRVTKSVAAMQEESSTTHHKSCPDRIHKGWWTLSWQLASIRTELPKLLNLRWKQLEIEFKKFRCTMSTFVVLAMHVEI